MSPGPAFLFVTASRTTGSFEAWCHAHGVAYQGWQLGGFTVVQPAVRVDPAQALPG